MLIVHFKEMFFFYVLLLCLQTVSGDVVNCFEWFSWCCYMHVMLCASCVQRNRNCWFEAYEDVEKCLKIDRSFLKQIHCRLNWQVVLLRCDCTHSKSQLLRLKRFIRSGCSFNLYNIHFSLHVTPFIQIRSFII